MDMSDKAIKKALGITPTDSDEESPKMDCNTIILEEYLARYSPADACHREGVFIRSTADIIAELSDMADLTADEVNTFLISRGFRPGRNNAESFGWLMSQRTG